MHAIDPDLSFETGAGRTSRHVLVVTAAGDPDRRDVARRWLAAAPAADAAFDGGGGGRWHGARRGEPPRVRALPEDARGQISFLCSTRSSGKGLVAHARSAVREG